MARAKKKDNLTLEEKLEMALVPVEEQPYEVPENWCWVRMGAICIFERGITFPASAKESKITEYNIPCLRTANIQEELNLDDILYVNRSYMRGNDEKFIREEDILMSSANSRELVGKVSYVNKIVEPMTFGGFVLGIRAKKIYSKYLFYELRHEFLSDNLGKESTQTTNIANISAKTLLNYVFPLPPLDEQKRIVKQIESLFFKLDEAKEKAQNVLDNSEDRKSAILFRAYSGALTKEWRKEKGISEDSWSKVLLKDVCKINPPKISAKDYDDDMEVSFFPMSALSEVTGTITEPQTRKLGEVKKGFTNFSEGDVVFAKITPCMENGKSAIIRKLVNDIGYGTTEFYVMRCSDKLLNGYLYHLVRSKHFRDEAKAVMTGAVGQQRVPKSFMEDYKIELPSVEEQRAILRLVDMMIEKEQTVADNCEEVIEQIDMMKKAVLAKAFRGELDTNNPDEESSVELLKRILNEPEKEKAKIISKKTIRRENRNQMTILELLKLDNKQTPEALLKLTGYDVNDFYEELKNLVKESKVREVREGKEVFLEVTDAN